MNAATADVTQYVAEQERKPVSSVLGRGYRPYASMCVNCEKMTKEIVRQGRPKDDVVKNFSASMWEWNGPTDARWPHLFRR